MSKNMYTNRNTHDTNCHRNYGGPNKDGKSASANDQTGLIPSGPQNDDEIKSYQDVFPFAPPLLKKDKDSLS